MTRNEYEQAQRRLEESRRAGVELVETAYQAQMRSLEMVWSLLGVSGDAPPPSETPRTAAPAAPEPPPSPPPAQRKRRPAGAVREEVRRIYPQLPEIFGRGDINALLGYTPERGALYRLLARLSSRKLISIESYTQGRTPAVYRKIAAELPPDD